MFQIYKQTRTSKKKTFSWGNQATFKTKELWMAIYIYNSLSSLAAPRPTLGSYLGDKLTYPILITAAYHIRPAGHRELHKEIESLNPAKRLVKFDSLRFTNNVSTY